MQRPGVFNHVTCFSVTLSILLVNSIHFKVCTHKIFGPEIDMLVFRQAPCVLDITLQFNAVP